jgi:hypothetical protein
MADKPAILPIAPAGEPDSGVSRRAAMQTLVAAVSAGFVLPSAVHAQHPIHAHLAHPEAVALTQRRAAAAAASKFEFFDTHQARTLEAIAEMIVPGSTPARVTPFLDQLLAVESPANQRDFLGALGAFDMAAIAKHGKVWTAISPQEQDGLMREASTAGSSTAIGTHFENLKTWIAGAYYSSEPGMRELGWTGNVFFPELPGCTHPGGHQE